MIRDKDTVNAILAMLDRRIERLQKDQNKARENNFVDISVKTGLRRQEAELIRQTIKFGEY
jgi:hypothetical protein